MASTPLLPPGDNQIAAQLTLRVQECPNEHLTSNKNIIEGSSGLTYSKSNGRTTTSRANNNRSRLTSWSSTIPTARCLRLRALLAIVSRRFIKYHHLVTFIIQLLVLTIVALCSGHTNVALGLSQEEVIIIVVLQISQTILSLFVLAGVLTHIKDQQWRTMDLSTLWLMTTIVFAGLYMTIAISYDSLLCNGTQPCTTVQQQQPPTTTTTISGIHVRPVSMPQLSSNSTFEYPDVWLKEYEKNITYVEYDSASGSDSTRMFKQMRLEMKPGVSGAMLLFLQFWYYSVQMQTQVGVGDVVPVCWLARNLAMVRDIYDFFLFL